MNRLSHFQTRSSETLICLHPDFLSDDYFAQHSGCFVWRTYVFVSAGDCEGIGVALTGLQKPGVERLGARRIAYLGRIDCRGWVAGSVMDRIADIFPFDSFAYFYREC